MIDWGTLILVIINGLVLGGIYALVTLGLNLIMGVMGIINFAHGEFLMIGMYTTYWLFVLFNVPTLASIPLTIFVCAAVSLLTERLLIEPVLTQGDVNKLLITAALSIFLQNIALVLWRADYRGIPSRGATTISFFGVTIGLQRLITLFVAFLVTFIFYFLLMKTDTGRRIRAVAQDREAAQLMGINVMRINMLVFALAGMLVGVAAALVAPLYYIYPGCGFVFGLMAWIVMVLGGLGSFEGSLIAALILGLVEALAGWLTNAEVARALAFVIFIIVLLIKPEGLFGRKKRVG